MWWAIFSIIPLVSLKNRQPQRTLPPGERLWTIGFVQLSHTLKSLPKYRHTLLFLVAYLLYNDGIQTVIVLATQFGEADWEWILWIVWQSIPRSLLLPLRRHRFCFALRLTAKKAIAISLIIWLGVTIYTYAFLQNVTQFFILGAVIAIVLGGSQALSRSLFSLMIPAGQEAEYFSLYEVSERGTSGLGPLIFGIALQLTGSYRLGILSIAIFFAIGSVFSGASMSTAPLPRPATWHRLVFSHDEGESVKFEIGFLGTERLKPTSTR